MIVDRYLAKSWLRMLGLCQGAFLAIYLVIDFMEKFGRFMRVGAQPFDIIKFFIFKLPEMVRDTMPFAVLMATLLALGALSRSSELTALRSCGLSIPRITRPLVLLGGGCSLLLLLNAEWLMPISHQRLEHIDKVVMRKEGGKTTFRLNNIWFRSDSLILQARQFDPAAQLLKGVVVWELSDRMEPLHRYEARQARPEGDGWVLEQGGSRGFGQNVGGVVPFLIKKLPISLKVADLKVLDKRADNLSFSQLRSYAQSLQRGGYNASRYLTMMHTKVALPFAALVMVVLGIPFALKTGRSGGVATGIGIGVSIGFAYFIVNAAVQSYGISGVLPPFIAAWGANVIFVLAGIWLAMTVKQQ